MMRWSIWMRIVRRCIILRGKKEHGVVGMEEYEDGIDFW